MSRDNMVGKLNWPVVIAISGIHLMALASFWHFTWSGLAIAVFLFWLTGWVGITLCYHRLLTHDSFETYRWFRRLLTFVGLLAFQGGPVSWVANHKLHHKHADKEGDPHSPKDGFDWAHIFWLFYDWPCGKKAAREEMKKLTRRLHEDPVLIFMDKIFWVAQIGLAVVLYSAGSLIFNNEVGISWLLMGVGLRTTAVYHATWATNSIGHKYGYRNYNTTDDSRNIWYWFAVFLLGGEGWHNGHHAFPKSAAHGLEKGEHDPTYWTILLLKRIGLVWNVYVPGEETLEMKRINKKAA